MIDMKELEKKFDDFFKTETLEQFNEWLKKKKQSERVNVFDLSEVAKVRRKNGDLK